MSGGTKRATGEAPGRVRHPTLANDMVALMNALGHQRFALYGTDVGMPIAYALAADHRDRVDRLVVSEAPLPGISASPPLFLPPPLNAMLWHVAFNQLPKINEQLVTGREGIFFGAEFDASAGTHKLPDNAVKYYIDTLAADPDHLRGSFGFYRAIPTTSAQNEKRKERRLTLPVLAIGGEESSGEGPGNTMKLVADDVQTMVLAGSGHWVYGTSLRPAASIPADGGPGQPGHNSCAPRPMRSWRATSSRSTCSTAPGLCPGRDRARDPAIRILGVTLHPTGSGPPSRPATS